MVSGAGVMAVVLRARLLLLGALLLLGTQFVVTCGYLPTEPVWLIPAAGAFILVDLLQGASVNGQNQNTGRDGQPSFADDTAEKIGQSARKAVRVW